MLQKEITAVAFIGCTIWLGYGVGQSGFAGIMAGYVPFFLLYLLVCFKTENTNIRFWLGTGILLRIILLFSFPNLSDDIYRFVWDGRLINHGYNPFDQLPGYYHENNILPDVLTPELYAALNSRDYHTIYPPVLQAIFAFATWLFPKSILATGIVMKAFLLAAEIGSMWLIIKILPQLYLPQRNVLFYALNPLAILEIMGNLHFEGLMIFFLLLGLWLLLQNAELQKNRIYSAMAMAGAIASKLLPLLFLPFLIGRLGWRRSLMYFSIIGIVLFLLFLPLLNGLFFNNFGASLNLYFQRFEFNASIYYIVKWFYRVALNDYYVIRSVGPALALFTFVSIMVLAVVRHNWSRRSVPESWLFAISIYLLFTTTVHPWYICLPLVLSVFTRWRYAIVWSGAAMLSYSHYQGGGFQEQYGFIITEYFLLFGFFIYEFIHFTKIKPVGINSNFK